MKLSLTCEHGTRTAEIEIVGSSEGVPIAESITGKRSIAATLIAEATPRCPYCEAQHAPVYLVTANEAAA